VPDHTWVRAALERGLENIEYRMLGDGFPHVMDDGSWTRSADGDWTGGFWIGLLWSGYEESGDEAFRTAAEQLLDRFVERAGERQNHDLGMMFSPSAVRGYELTGNSRHRDAALEAAESLAAQFNERGGFIPGWGYFGDEGWEGRTLIDTLMNLPLLMWASAETGDERLREVALTHGETALAHHFRADGSTFHVYRFDPETGDPIGGDTYQGKGADSCWTRGQAWAITGCTLLARAGAGASYADAAARAASYYLEHLPTHLVPPWDFDAHAPDEPRDSSAGAIAAYGLLLLGGHLADDSLVAAGEDCLRALAEAAQAPAWHPAILLHATADLPHGIGIDESTIYGDYFFIRALQRLYSQGSPTAGAGSMPATDGDGG
jgi:unsaturated chondroitin disaccharide hydrolase